MKYLLGGLVRMGESRGRIDGITRVSTLGWWYYRLAMNSLEMGKCVRVRLVRWDL